MESLTKFRLLKCLPVGEATVDPCEPLNWQKLVLYNSPDGKPQIRLDDHRVPRCPIPPICGAAVSAPTPSLEGIHRRLRCRRWDRDIQQPSSQPPPPPPLLPPRPSEPESESETEPEPSSGPNGATWSSERSASRQHSPPEAIDSARISLINSRHGQLLPRLAARFGSEGAAHTRPRGGRLAGAPPAGRWGVGHPPAAGRRSSRRVG